MSTLILTYEDLIETGKEPTKDNIRYNVDDYEVVLFKAGNETIIQCGGCCFLLSSTRTNITQINNNIGEDYRVHRFKWQ